MIILENSLSRKKGRGTRLQESLQKLEGRRWKEAEEEEDEKEEEEEEKEEEEEEEEEKEEEEKECGNEVPCRGRGPCFATGRQNGRRQLG